MRETFPPLQLDDALEAQVVREIADAPRHDADLRMRQPAQRRFVKVIEVRVRQQHEINRRQIADLQAGALDAFQQKQPVREIRIHQHVQVGELDQKRRVADPGDRHLAGFQLGKYRSLVLAGATGEQRLPDHFVKERARLKCPRGRQFLERSRQALRRTARPMKMTLFAFHGV